MLLDCGFPFEDKKNLWHCPFTMQNYYITPSILSSWNNYTWSIPEVLWILWSGPASGSGSQPETTHLPPKVHTNKSYCILYRCIMFYIITIQPTVICSWQQGRKIYYRNHSILSHFVKTIPLKRIPYEDYLHSYMY